MRGTLVAFKTLCDTAYEFAAVTECWHGAVKGCESLATSELIQNNYCFGKLVIQWYGTTTVPVPSTAVTPASGSVGFGVAGLASVIPDMQVLSSSAKNLNHHRALRYANVER